jgi:competence protein ComEC
MGFLIIIMVLFDVLPTVITEFYEYILFVLNRFVEWIGSQESFLFQNISFSLTAVLLYYIFIISFFKWTELKKIGLLRLMLLTIILFQINLITNKFTAQSKSEFVVFNKSQNTILGFRKGEKLEIYHDLDSAEIVKNNIIKDFVRGSGSQKIYVNNKLKNIYKLNQKKLLVIDSFNVFNIKKINPKYILLRQSPQLNLERVIKTLHPELIIADASNYRNYIEKWERTCHNYNIKFYYTSKKGAFTTSL